MRIFTALTLTAAMLAAPTAAFAARTPSHAELIAAGCTIQHDRTPSGKGMMKPPVVKCPDSAMAAIGKNKPLKTGNPQVAVN